MVDIALGPDTFVSSQTDISRACIAFETIDDMHVSAIPELSMIRKAEVT